MGFYLGYSALFLMALLGYHFHLKSTIWLEWLGALLPLGIGYISAQLVPFNLWRAYGRLSLMDGGVFFVFLLVGPFWSYFFLNFHTTFLTPVVGLIVVLLAATSLAALMDRQLRKTGETIIPVHLWVLIYGTILVLYEFSIGGNWYGAICLISLIIVLSVLLSHERIQFNLSGMLVFLLVLGLLLVVLDYNLWLGRALTVLLTIFWWRWGRRLLSLPPSFWMVVLIITISSWALKSEYLSAGWASTTIVLITLIVSLWEHYRGVRQ